MRRTVKQIEQKARDTFARIGLEVNLHGQMLDERAVRLSTPEGRDIGPRLNLRSMDLFLDGVSCVTDEMYRLSLTRNQKADELIQLVTGCTGLDDYLSYLTQLADDNHEIGMGATAEDYRNMGKILRSLLKSNQ